MEVVKKRNLSAKTIKPRKVMPARKWSNDKLDALKAYFKNYLNGNVLPGKDLIIEAQEAHPVLKTRTWRNIKRPRTSITSGNGQKVINGAFSFF